MRLTANNRRSEIAAILCLNPRYRFVTRNADVVGTVSAIKVGPLSRPQESGPDLIPHPRTPMRSGPLFTDQLWRSVPSPTYGRSQTASPRLSVLGLAPNDPDILNRVVIPALVE